MKAVRGYVENNTLTVAGIGIVVLAVLVLVIVILFIPLYQGVPYPKAPRQEERERLRMAEEIDRKTASEIEQELREAMEQKDCGRKDMPPGWRRNGWKKKSCGKPKKS